MEIYDNMSRIQERKKMAKDYLQPFVRITYDLMILKYTKLVLSICYSTYFFSIVLGIHGFLTTKDTHFIAQYGSTFGLQLFMFINLGAILLNLDPFKQFFEWYRKVRPPYEIMDKKLIRKVEVYSKLAIAIVLLIYVLTVISYITLSSGYHYFNRVSYLRVWISANMPEYFLMLVIVIHVIDAIAAFVMVSSPTAVIYFGISGVFQIMLVNEFVKKICSSKIPPGERYNSELYQKLVEQRMKICVILHDQAISTSIAAGDLIYAQIILFVLASIIMGASLMLGIISAYSEKEYMAFLGLNMYGLCSTLCGIVYTSIGQIVKNESERLWYCLVQLPWYYMNKKNLKIYSVLLRKSEKPIALSGDLIEVNFLLFVKIFRALYSAAAVVLRMSPTEP